MQVEQFHNGVRFLEFTNGKVGPLDGEFVNIAVPIRIAYKTIHARNEAIARGILAVRQTCAKRDEEISKQISLRREFWMRVVPAHQPRLVDRSNLDRCVVNGN